MWHDAAFAQIVSRRGELVAIVDRIGHRLETRESWCARKYPRDEVLS